MNVNIQRILALQKTVKIKKICYGRCVLLEDVVEWQTSSAGDVGTSQCMAAFITNKHTYQLEP